MMHHYNRPQIMNARKVELLTDKRRAEEQRVKELVRYNTECQRLSMNMKDVDKIHKHNRDKRSAIDVAEEAKRQRDERRRKESLIQEREEKVERGKKLQELEREKMEREIQRICESSEELKELERTLKVAYVNKERAAQHQETLLIKRVESTQQQMIEEEMERQRQDLIRKEQEKDINRRHKLVDQKIVLQKQMKENEVRLFYQQ